MQPHEPNLFLLFLHYAKPFLALFALSLTTLGGFLMGWTTKAYSQSRLH